MPGAAMRGPHCPSRLRSDEQPRRSGNHTEQHYTATSDHQPAPTTRFVRAAPHPDVVAAAEFLLAEPDAYLYRRRYLELITHTPGPNGANHTDYTAAEKYLLTTAARRRKALRRPTTLYAVRRTTSPPPTIGETTQGRVATRTRSRPLIVGRDRKPIDGKPPKHR